MEASVDLHERGRVLVGVDVVSVADVAASIQRFGDRYLRRVFTSGELETCSTPTGVSAERLAARFAAKESVVKALSPTCGVGFHDVEVTGAGRPELVLHGAMATHSEAVGVVGTSLSFSHDHGVATAVVVAVTDPSPAAAPPTPAGDHHHG